jgi:hypothetical protein
MNKTPRLALSPLLLAPIFLGFTLNGWRIRILPPNGAQSTHAFAAPGGWLPDFEKGADGRSAYFRRKTLGGSGIPCLPSKADKLADVSLSPLCATSGFVHRSKNLRGSRLLGHLVGARAGLAGFRARAPWQS